MVDEYNGRTVATKKKGKVTESPTRRLIEHKMLVVPAEIVPNRPVTRVLKTTGGPRQKSATRQGAKGEKYCRTVQSGEREKKRTDDLIQSLLKVGLR